MVFRQEKVIQIPFFGIWTLYFCVLGQQDPVCKYFLLWSSEFSQKHPQNIFNKPRSPYYSSKSGKHLVNAACNENGTTILSFSYSHEGLSALHLTVIPPNFKCWKQISDHNCFNTFLSTLQHYGTPCFYSTGKQKSLFRLRETVQIYCPDITQNVQSHLTGRLMNTLFLAAVLFLCRFEHVVDL